MSETLMLLGQLGLLVQVALPALYNAVLAGANGQLALIPKIWTHYGKRPVVLPPKALPVVTGKSRALGKKLAAA